MAETPPVLQFQRAASTALGCFNLLCLSLCATTAEPFVPHLTLLNALSHSPVGVWMGHLSPRAKSCCSSTAFCNSWCFLWKWGFLYLNTAGHLLNRKLQSSVCNSQFFACKAEGRYTVVKALPSTLLYCWSHCKRYLLVVQLFKVWTRETNQLCKGNKINAIISARQM